MEKDTNQTPSDWLMGLVIDDYEPEDYQYDVDDFGNDDDDALN